MYRKTFAYGVGSEKGVWPVQEDGFYVEPSRGIFALLDGFGGKGAGDIAVKKAVEEIRKHLDEMNVSASGPYNKKGQWQRYIFSSANEVLLDWNKGNASHKRGGCALLLGNIDENNVLTATNLGNCCLLILRKGEFCPLLLPQVEEPFAEVGTFFPDQSLGLMVDILPETRSTKLVAGDLVIGLTSELARHFTLIKDSIAQWTLEDEEKPLWSDLAEEVIRLEALARNRNRTALFMEAREQIFEIIEDFGKVEEAPLILSKFDPLQE